MVHALKVMRASWLQVWVHVVPSDVVRVSGHGFSCIQALRRYWGLMPKVEVGLLGSKFPQLKVPPFVPVEG